MKLVPLRIRVTKRLAIIIGLLAIIAGGIACCYLLFIKDSQPGLSKETEEQYRLVYEAMQENMVKDMIDPSRLLEVQTNIKSGKYDLAKSAVEEMLAEEPTTDFDKPALLTLLSSTCLPLKDFDCVDKVIENYGSNFAMDHFYLVDAARLARQEGRVDDAKRYYKIALDDLDRQGGEEFVNSMNQNLQEGIDYNEIRVGAQ